MLKDDTEEEREPVVWEQQELPEEEQAVTKRKKRKRGKDVANANAGGKGAVLMPTPSAKGGQEEGMDFQVAHCAQKTR